ncbi:MAG: O-antigen ligase family protein [Candidatus Solibacter usitatus]|nr:O-antigen ligase family protein [Candidatus Solibacter usitatus]
MRTQLKAVALAGLTAILGFAVFARGGVVYSQWNYCLLAMGLLGCIHWIGMRGEKRPPPLERALKWPLALLPCYALFQIIPLPVTLLRMLSPSRAALEDALQPVTGVSGFATLSVVPEGTLQMLLQICAYTVCFLLVRDLGFRLRQRRWLLAAPLVAIGLLEAIYGLLEFSTGSEVSGTYPNRNHFAGYLEMVLPFCVVYALAAARQVWADDGGPPSHLRSAIAGIAAAAMMVAILCSLSRGGLLSSILSMLVIAALLLAARGATALRRLALSAVVVAGIVGVTVFLSPQKLLQRLASEEFLSRYDIWVETVPMIKAYLLFGCGLNGFEPVFLHYRISLPTRIADYAHNDYLQLLAEAGIAGFLIGSALFLGILFRIVKSAISHPTPKSQYLAMACAGSMAAIALHSFTDYNMYIPANALLLSWITGIAASIRTPVNNTTSS